MLLQFCPGGFARSGRLIGDTDHVDIEPARRHSPDGEWWWSGSEWLPAWSADRRWWFDGLRWTPTRKQGLARAFRRQVAMLGGWLLVWLLSLAWSAYVLAVSPDGAPVIPLITGAALLICWVGGSVASGFLLAFHAAWPSVVLMAGYVWVLSMAWYVASMLIGPDPAGTNDIGAGAGVVILGIPMFLVIGTLVSVGAGLRAVGRSVSRRRSEAMPADGPRA